MKLKRSSKNGEPAFSLTELGVLMACAGILALLVVPAFASNKIQSAAIGCLYNLRHLQTGCAMYCSENNSYLMPNAPEGATSTTAWCGGQAESLTSFANANTNQALYKSALLWPYLDNNLNVFHCPADTVPSPNGPRIRSYSMNGQMGANNTVQTLDQQDNPGYLTYAKDSDIIRPTPANAFVFGDESPDSINDGWLQISSSSPEFPDIPACYLEGGCGFSFADGHAEIHRWQTSSLLIPMNRELNNVFAAGGKFNADWVWYTQHATSQQ